MKTFTKKSVAIVLTILMVFSTLIVGTVTANAESTVTLYFVDDANFVGSYVLTSNACQSNGENRWVQKDMTNTGKKYKGSPIYKVETTEIYGGFDKLQFQLWTNSNHTDHKGQINAFSSWNTTDKFNGKMYLASSKDNGSWINYQEDSSTPSSNSTSTTASDTITIYFKDNLGWGGASVYLYKNGQYWSDDKGTGSSQKSEHFYGGPFKMTKVSGTNDVYSYTYKGAHSSYIAFTKDSQDNYDNFYETEVVYRGDFDAKKTMFTPQSKAEQDSKKKTINNSTYYNEGEWSAYQTPTSEPKESTTSTSSSSATAAPTTAAPTTAAPTTTTTTATEATETTTVTEEVPTTVAPTTAAPTTAAPTTAAPTTVAPTTAAPTTAAPTTAAPTTAAPTTVAPTTAAPTLKGTYYLVGYIEKNNYTGNNYKFNSDGTLTVNFKEDSYVYVKNASGTNYMTKTYSDTAKAGDLYSTSNGGKEKLHAGSGEITFNLKENADGSLHLSFTKVEQTYPTGENQQYTFYYIPLQADENAGCSYYINFGMDSGDSTWQHIKFTKTNIKQDGRYLYKATVTSNITAAFKNLQYQVYDSTGQTWKHQIAYSNVTLSSYNNKVVVATSDNAGKLEDYKPDESPSSSGSTSPSSSVTGSTVYLNASFCDKTDEGAEEDWYAWTWTGDSMGHWVSASNATDKSKITYQGIEAKVLFVRVKKGDQPKFPSDTDDGNIWNQTDDLDTVANGTYTITAWHPDGVDSGNLVGTWSKPSESETTKPVTGKQYYLVGTINGKDIDDTQYEIVNGKLTLTITQDSYVAVRDADNVWYMTHGFPGMGVTETTLYKTYYGEPDTDKLHVSAGEITFTLVDNGNDTLKLSYVKSGDTPTSATNPSGTTTTVQTNPNEKQYTFYFIPLQADEDAGCTFYINFGMDADDGTWQHIKFTKTNIKQDGRYLYKATVTSNVTEAFKNFQYQVYDSTGETWQHQIAYNNVTLSSYNNKVVVATGETSGKLEDYKPDESPKPSGSTSPSSSVTGSTVYLNASFCDKTDEGAEEDWYAWTWTGDSMGHWVSASNATDKSKITYQGIEAKVLFVRVKKGDQPKFPSDTDDGNIWNQTDDLDTVANGTYTITAWHPDGVDSGNLVGTWSKPSESETTKPVTGKQYYLVGTINGKDIDDTQYEIVNGKLTLTITQDSYVAVRDADNVWYMTHGFPGMGVTETTLYKTYYGEPDTDKLHVAAGEITFTLVDNGNDTLKLSYVKSGDTPTSATNPSETKPVTGKQYYLVGTINGVDFGIGNDYDKPTPYPIKAGETITTTFEGDAYINIKDIEKNEWFFTDGFPGMEATSAIFYNEKNHTFDPNDKDAKNKLYIPGNVEVKITLVDNGNDTLTLSYVKSGDTPTSATNPSETKPVTGKQYYLVGTINGVDFGIGNDYDKPTPYPIKAGETITTTFEGDAYINIKDIEKNEWFFTDGFPGMEATSAIFYNEKNHTFDPNDKDAKNKLYIPGNVEVKITLVDNGNDTLTLSYVKSGDTPTSATNPSETTKPNEKQYTFYYLPSQASVDAGYTFKLNINDSIADAPEHWYNYNFTNTGKTMNGLPVYSVTFTADFEDANTVQYQVYNGSDWVSEIAKTPIKLTELNNKVVIDDGNGTIADLKYDDETTPTTAEPTTVAPTTVEPTTVAPTTVAPTTVAPTTVAPTTVAPTTVAPTTVAPTTVAPTTVAPTTVAPTTVAPTTVAPTTVAPTTVAPTTVAPTTVAPKPKPTQPPTVKPAKDLGPGTDEKVVDVTIKNLKNDSDPKGSKFGLLKAKAAKTTKTSITVSWTKVKGAKKYIIYSNKCGKTKGKINAYKKIKTTTAKSIKLTKINGKKIVKGTYYKFLIVAVNSKGKVVSTSKTIHVATKGGKVTNYKSIKLNASSKTLKKGKTFKVKVTSKTKQVKKASVKNHRSFKYESSNTKIATVSSKGKIKAKKKGTCYVYVYAQNGVYKRIKIKVK